MPLIFAWTALSGFQSTGTLSIAYGAFSGFRLSEPFLFNFFIGICILTEAALAESKSSYLLT
jgi:hypothetical protein